jgi:hypothetical protein
MALTVDWLYLPKGKSYAGGVRGLTWLVADSFDMNFSELASVAYSHQRVVVLLLEHKRELPRPNLM